jgi:isopentenyl-diphosphate delta-isomerase
MDAFSFEYRETFENNLTEHELDHVLIGYSDENPILNPEEAKDYRWINWTDLLGEIESNPQNFTIWFKIILANHIEKLQKELCHASV